MVAHSIPVESRPPVAHTTAPFPPGVVFRKTAAGRQALAARRSALGLRERQILILCTGERGLEALSEVFGPEAEADLRRLVDQGLVKVGARTVWPVGGAVDAIPERFLGWLRPGGRMFIVRGHAPAMEAVLVHAGVNGPRIESLFETDLAYLAGAAPVPAFAL